MSTGAGEISTTEREVPPTVADQLAREDKRLRINAGSSQRELAAMICYSRQYVSMTEWEDAVLPSQPLIAAIDDALGAQGRLIALRAWAQTGRRTGYALEAAKGWHPEENWEIPDSIVLEKHRQAVSDRSDESSEDLVDVLGRIHKLSRTTDPEIVRQLRSRTRTVIEEYETLDHTELAPGLIRQRVLVDKLIDECNHPQQRRELFETAGHTAGLLGYIAVGQGNFSLARAYCLESFQLGEHAVDCNLQAWACGLQSFCEYYAGNYESGLQYARKGITLDRSGPQRARLLVNGAARAMGKLGEIDGVRRAVDDAYDLMSRNNVPIGVPSSVTLGSYSAAQVSGNAATAYLSLPITDEVERHVKLAAPEMNTTSSPWGSTFVRTHNRPAEWRPQRRGAQCRTSPRSPEPSRNLALGNSVRVP
ncbi:helix-turn-helix domain-containing protein [Nocardia flavorosea]|uniref:Helix-turn-helix transcriptional regulator n=1 Tax=Nocardia flavorosea TaxID=53429 RepID=A0A846YC96_9NOCA|nr:helix-turn-helix transcriptional regulator [Nocardia flavorosea]NKY56703.1 helix-turn-helix transcriptional regulator [Nocardia flavorosea]